ncbi:hypothetical protein ACWDFL_32300 [Streptomyces bungoensis]
MPDLARLALADCRGCAGPAEWLSTGHCGRGAYTESGELPR